MQSVTFIQLIIGLLNGGGLGALMGYLGKCTTGTCPLTTNPRRGAFIGALMGGLFAFSMGSSGATAVAAGAKHAAVQISSPAQFERDVLKADQPVLVDFYADWCGPCRKLAPTIEKLAKQYEGRAIVRKVNVDRLTSLADRYGVQSIPTVILFKDGKEVQRLTGVRSAGEYAKVLDQLLARAS